MHRVLLLLCYSAECRTAPSCLEQKRQVLTVEQLHTNYLLTAELQSIRCFNPKNETVESKLCWVLDRYNYQILMLEDCTRTYGTVPCASVQLLQPASHHYCRRALAPHTFKVSSCVSPVCMGGMPSGRSISRRWPRRGCSSCCQAGWPVAADSSCPLQTPAATTTPRRARTLAHPSAHNSQHTTRQEQDNRCSSCLLASTRCGDSRQGLLPAQGAHTWVLLVGSMWNPRHPPSCW